MNSNSISVRLSRHIQNALELSKEDHDKLKYSIEVLFGESSKLIILLLIFFAFGVHAVLLQALVALFLIRINTGGLHFKTYLGCLSFSAVFFASVTLLYEYAKFPPLLLTATGLIGLVAIALYAPITSALRPNYSTEERRRFRRRGCIVVSLHLIGFWATKNNPYFTISVWVIFLQAIQLLIAKEMKRNEKKASI